MCKLVITCGCVFIVGDVYYNLSYEEIEEVGGKRKWVVCVTVGCGMIDVVVNHGEEKA